MFLELFTKYSAWIRVLVFLLALLVAVFFGIGVDSKTVVAVFVVYATTNFLGSLTVEHKLNVLQKSADAAKESFTALQKLVDGGKLIPIDDVKSHDETLRLIRDARRSIVHFTTGRGGSQAPADFYPEYTKLIKQKVETQEFESFKRASFFQDTDRRSKFVNLVKSLSKEGRRKAFHYDLGDEAQAFLSMRFLISDKASGIVVITTGTGHDQAFTVHGSAAECFNDLFSGCLPGRASITDKLAAE